MFEGDNFTGAQAEFWGPRVLTLPDILIAPHPASTGAETSQMALKGPNRPNIHATRPMRACHMRWQTFILDSAKILKSASKYLPGLSRL